ncbi:hypothetical protein Nepgr_005004 [Nepenthes gracilis]|uniref:Uncharacterized protein n=1 Tax=Nepenthes gracilis TaxID=150966 RepID=A0AAD3XFW7_NEPGR|nr:hypothetical protein Nepgr_005004 [Nepenthes gracilis]
MDIAAACWKHSHRLETDQLGETVSGDERGQLECMTWNPMNYKKFERLSHLPPLSHASIAMTIDNMLSTGLDSLP